MTLHAVSLFSGIGLLDLGLDHIKPFSLGGPNTVANLRVTHSLCNMRRGARV